MQLPPPAPDPDPIPPPIIAPPLSPPAVRPEPASAAEEFDPVTVNEMTGELAVQWRSLPEAKHCLKKLKLLKKQILADKRAATAAQRQIRAEYTHMVRQRGSKVRGGGWIGSIVRAGQTASRDADRAQLANLLAPWEAKKNRCDQNVHQIDGLIIQVEEALLG
jgi:hypothetical protein